MQTKEEFLNFVRQNIFPELEKEESNRKKNIYIWKWGMYLLSVIIVVLLWNKCSDKSDVLYPAILPIIIGGMVLVTYKNKLKKKFYNNILDKLGFFPDKKITNAIVNKLEKNYLLPNHNVRKHDDSFSKKIEDVTLSVLDTKLILKTGSGKRQSSRTVFEGLIIMFQLEKDYPADTVLYGKKYTLFNSAPKDSWERVTLEDPDFNKQYYVYSENQIAVRRLLKPAFMECLKEIETVYKTPANILFEKNNIMLTLNTRRDMFEFIDINKNMAREEPFIEFYDQISALIKLKNILKLD